MTYCRPTPDILAFAKDFAHNFLPIIAEAHRARRENSVDSLSDFHKGILAISDKYADFRFVQDERGMLQDAGQDPDLVTREMNEESTRQEGRRRRMLEIFLGMDEVPDKVVLL